MAKSNPTEPQQAVIYCRVSSTKQAKVGDGLKSQQTICREYAAQRGLTVAEVFEDDLTGALVKRPGMSAMLSFLRKNKRKQFVVIIDDISRLARDIRTHFDLREAITLAGGNLESPNMEFSDDPDSEFKEIIMAGLSHVHRRKNAAQTSSRMRARMLNGYWVFRCPIGYRYEKTSDRGKILVRDEPLASIVTEALEGFASGRFPIQADVERFLAAQPEFPIQALPTRITDLMQRLVYTGYMEFQPWGVTLRKGHHEPLISMETFRRIQERRSGAAKAPSRQNTREDFPLRGFVVCGDCGSPLTSCWSKGNTSYHPYYFCKSRGCVSYGKSIRRAVIEEEFDTLLTSLRPSRELIQVASRMFKEHWEHLGESQQARKRELQSHIAKIDKECEQFLDRIALAQTPSVIAAYENRIRKLDEEKVITAEKIVSCGRPIQPFDTALRTSLAFLANPCLLWHSEYYEDKRAVLRLAFEGRLAYQRKEGFRTSNTALPFKVLADFSCANTELVGREGVEPSTKRLRVSCSTN